MPLTVSLADVSEGDLPLVGGKASKLGEVLRQGLPVPPGIVLSTEAYERFVSETNLHEVIPTALASLDPSRPETIEAASRTIRSAFEAAPLPSALASALTHAIQAFLDEHKVRFVAVRSSATAEDLEGASFAGLQETYLNVQGVEAILAAVRRCWGSLFTPRVLVYRARKGFDHATVRLAVLVQKMVEATVSGILFTRDPNTGENHMIVEAGFGLGEAIVGGEVTPDHYVVDGASQRIVHKQISEQTFRLDRAPSGGNVKRELPPGERDRQKLPDDRILRLASLARVIESHYRRPMDVEWCADATSLYIVQARPVTTLPADGPGPPRSSPSSASDSARAGEAPG
ncbi:MAG TPA: PEP/pyruvate-binding domain-containing protein, partial [Thermoplasmata archaeon]|nr:PEP/pyruvate-binding domain-containing protein [Thermoplasmata archaeon]